MPSKDQQTPPDQEAKVAAMLQVLEPPLKKLLLEALTPLQLSLTSLAEQVKALKTAAPVAAAQAGAKHTHGLCEDVKCEACVRAAQLIADNAYARGKSDTVKLMDEALLYSGGEPLRERVAQVVQQGIAIVEQRAQPVSIGA